MGPKGLSASGVEIPSNLLISSGCLGLSGLNLTDCTSAGFAPLGGCEALRVCGGGGERGGGEGLLGLGGLVHVAGGCLGVGLGLGSLEVSLALG